MIWDGLLVSLLVPEESQLLIVCFRLHPFWNRMMVLCLLHPMMGFQEAHLQIRYVFAVWYFDQMYPSFIVFDVEIERASALDI